MLLRFLIYAFKLFYEMFQYIHIYSNRMRVPISLHLCSLCECGMENQSDFNLYFFFIPSEDEQFEKIYYLYLYYVLYPLFCFNIDVFPVDF